MKNFKIFIPVFFIIFNGIVTKAQVNLVSNPSFEGHTSCPTSHFHTHFIEAWDLDFNTSDFFHECSTLNFSIPQNVMGYQCANTGNAYVGILPYTHVFGSDRREYIGGKLSDSLIVGTKYYVNFKVSLANESACAINNIGMKFLANNLIDSNLFTSYIVIPPVYLTNTAQINYPTIITDTMGWITVKGSFIADSSYINFLIGNFYSIANIDSIVQSGWPTCQAYYYVDDVCISSDSLLCESIKKQVINITADSNYIYQNSCINFNLLTSIDYNSFEWHFTSALPSTSNSLNPINICYNNSGSFDVTFIGHKNGGCTDTVHLSNFIVVDSLSTVNDFETQLNNIQVAFFENILAVTNLSLNTEYVIYDIIGQEVKKGNFIETNIQINCNTFNEGAYMLVIKNSTLKPFKFIVHKNSN